MPFLPLRLSKWPGSSRHDSCLRHLIISSNADTQRGSCAVYPNNKLGGYLRKSWPNSISLHSRLERLRAIRDQSNAPRCPNSNQSRNPSNRKPARLAEAAKLVRSFRGEESKLRQALL